MHTVDDIIKAKKFLTEKGYNIESDFRMFKVAELMAEWAVNNKVAVCDYCSGTGWNSYPNHSTTMPPCPKCKP
ncbi:MAG: hypothetical protein QM503_10645 [Bacteroidota bacterium]